MTSTTATTSSTPELKPGHTGTVHEGHVACRGCGCEVKAPADEKLILWAQSMDTINNPGGQPHPAPSEPLGQCVDCADDYRQAEAVLARLPQLGRLYGSPAVDRVAQVYAGWRALEKHPRNVAAFTVADWRRWCDKFGPAGADARWISQYAPITHLPPGRCNRRPFGHLDDDQRGALRRRYANATIATFTAEQPDRPMPPPDIPHTEETSSAIPVPGGCLLCGRGSVSAPAGTSANAVWSFQRLSLASIGGRPNQRRVRAVGWCDPACTEALGPLSAQRSTKAGLDYAIAIAAGAKDSWNTRDDVIVGDSITAWAVLYIDAVKAGQEPPAPNREPFAHIGDRAELERIVAGQPEDDDPTVDHETGLSADRIVALLTAAGYRVERASGAGS